MPLVDKFNTSYMGEVYFGTPPQKIRALFDTGSANCWVFSETAKKDLSPKLKSQRTYYAYNPAKSSTAGKPNMDSRCRIGFGSGWLKGMFTTDTVTLGNPNTPSKCIKVPNFNFGKVYHQSNIFTGHFDALVGLAYPSMAQPGQTPFFDQLMKHHAVKHDLFAFFLSYNAKKEPSEITFGFYDPNRFVKNSLTWHKVTHPVFFAIKL